MKSIDEIRNYDELVDELAKVIFEHDSECTRVDEAVWIDLDENGIAIVVVTSADTWKLGNAEFLCLLNGTHDDALDQLIEFSDSPIYELAYILDMEESELILYASECTETDVEDTGIDEIKDYIRSTPELMTLIEDAFYDYLNDSIDYQELAKLRLDQLEKTLQYR